ncbi:phosphatase PAP2 family protein [Demequina sp. TTPB684]|uniref:phosphatase PAP2 family protein n=1 Tax=unclassified Demequina TaxID=2620311 RepID=UPI001CF184FD|nr:MULTISPECIES: phosphatase PAP2 family protein [unclassified Demequina]MCB2412579.1 phosphatase PAP2 family protein [Demequina sp. TTPB684]UPU87559.1 phosphatase PAP2 family protein [Demequina sp. TMPB413]
MIVDLIDRLTSPVMRAVLPGLALTAAGVWAFVGVLDQFLEREDIYLVDQPALDWLIEIRTPWLTTTLTVITNAFGPVILPIVIGVACVVWARLTRAWRDPFLLAAAMVMSTVVAMTVKMLVARPRPADDLQVIPGLETSYSFPSGHTTGATTLVLVTAYLLWRRRRGRRSLAAWGLVSVVIVLIVGGSRLYLGYHFVTDVLAGACLGLVTLGLVVAASRWLDLRRRRADDAAVTSA